MRVDHEHVGVAGQVPDAALLQVRKALLARLDHLLAAGDDLCLQQGGAAGRQRHHRQRAALHLAVMAHHPLVQVGTRHAEPKPRPGHAEDIGEGPRHDDVLALRRQKGRARRAGEVRVGLVHQHDRAGRLVLDQPADVGDRGDGPGRVVRRAYGVHAGLVGRQHRPDVCSTAVVRLQRDLGHLDVQPRADRPGFLVGRARRHQAARGRAERHHRARQRVAGSGPGHDVVDRHLLHRRHVVDQSLAQVAGLVAVALLHGGVGSALVAADPHHSLQVQLSRHPVMVVAAWAAPRDTDRPPTAATACTPSRGEARPKWRRE